MENAGVFYSLSSSHFPGAYNMDLLSVGRQGGFFICGYDSQVVATRFRRSLQKTIFPFCKEIICHFFPFQKKTYAILLILNLPGR